VCARDRERDLAPPSARHRRCYVGFTPPGVLLDYGRAIRAPIGRIHWAGAETAA